MHHPRREELAHGHVSQFGMKAAEIEFFIVKGKRLKRFNALATQLGELAKQFVRGFAFDKRREAAAIEWFESAILLTIKDDAGARNPIRHLAEDQVTEHVDRAEGVGFDSGIEPSAGLT